MASQGQPAAFGTWRSPLTPEFCSQRALQIEEPEYCQVLSKVWYIERRPHEQGRSCIVEYENGKCRDVLPHDYSVRTRVHEYGGAAMRCSPDGMLVFSDHQRNGVFSLDPSSDPSQIYHSICGLRHEPPISELSSCCPRESHNIKCSELHCSFDRSTGEEKVVASGCDFYSHPRFAPNGKYVCYLCWNHPNMQWTNSTLYVVHWTAEKTSLSSPRIIAGNLMQESISQPRWGPDGTLFFVSDKTGYYQLYKGDSEVLDFKQVCLKGLDSAEFAAPEWTLASTTYMPLTSTTIVAATTKLGTTFIILINADDNTFIDLRLPLVSIKDKALCHLSDTEFIVVGSTLTTGPTLYHVDVMRPNLNNIIKTTGSPDIPISLYSTPRHIIYPLTRNGSSGNAFFFPPQNPNFHGPQGESPPVILIIHGGPTLHANPGFSVAIQYWTSRGYAVTTCNPCGSSGYGKVYRDQLLGKWGEADVSDIKDCAVYLSRTSLVNPSRIGIVGRSSGAYVALRALIEYPSLWSAGICFYGISDLESLLKSMHKFEAWYARSLLFGYAKLTEAETKTLCDLKSPYLFATKISAPLMLVHGEDDPIVPISQAEAMAKGIREKGGVVELLSLQLEGHGIRKGANIVKVKQAEGRWWAEHLAG